MSTEALTMPHFTILKSLLEERIPNTNYKIFVVETQENTH